MRRLCVLVAVLVVAAVLAGCSGGSKTLTAADDGTAVDLKVGDTLTIELPGNPSTGYSWNGPVPDVITSTGDPEFASDAGKGVVGAGGTVTMRYEAVKAGEATLDLQYSRLWESKQPEDTFSVTISVR